ncbi:MAG: CRISPR-associated helicase Cas3' [bacterium]
MVHDLEFYSHPDKPLEEHIRGVLQGTLLRSSISTAEMAALFHDLGKINPNFQNRLFGKNTGYANHSHLSVICWVNYALSNINKLLDKNLIENKDEFPLFILQVATLIGKHHQNLPNLERAFTGSEELIRAASFADENIDNLPVKDFLVNKLEETCNNFELKWGKQNEMVVAFLRKHHKKIWQTAPLKYFMDTQEAFAALIEADKRDAGNNPEYFFNATIEENMMQLNHKLTTIFNEFEKNTDESLLNKLRTDIRLETVKNIEKALESEQRIFTLTAPTGAGKTLTMLSAANKIRQLRGKLGIIYALPFLSITEQVQEIVKTLVEDVLSVNSKTENERIKQAQQSFENNQTKENLETILKEDFIQNTFDHPFVITTFVQFFETLVSNKNSTLLKLPNFSKRIFLIDEVQALPPRLYIFFAAWLHEFCERNDSYTILSTATMPQMEIPIKETDDNKRADLLFTNYSPPKELLNCKKYFAEDIFNRYQINVIKEKQTNKSLARHILDQENSCLVILNTIADTKKLYDELKGKAKNVKLLNTYFIPDDRKSIIKLTQESLSNNEKVVLISTQLIEAGVDIDFPVVYRDMCPLPSLIQSAGRCNRNNKLSKGQVYFLELVDDNGRSRAQLIYRNEGRMFLDFCRNRVSTSIDENQLFDIQSEFFTSIQQNLTIGEFSEDGDDRINMIECINNAKFETLGKFKLINDHIGKQEQYYILRDEEDDSYEKLEKLLDSLKAELDFSKKKHLKIQISDFLKQLSGRMLNIRVNSYNKSQLPQQYREEVLGIKFISSDNYSSSEGLILDNIETSFL